ncbi:hypothetical protein EIP91_009731 [Steccherinum ochraceum]|uniref:Uncharacterized protein n=1 Tax=Steccherinum ochraceum TaxID=92696 RepID=A0A4R0R3K8_9APHY|nr:hypothetical protein EIP91_009731 [Steccherinum ochraceum]
MMADSPRRQPYAPLPEIEDYDQDDDAFHWSDIELCMAALPDLLRQQRFTSTVDFPLALNGLSLASLGNSYSTPQDANPYQYQYQQCYQQYQALYEQQQALLAQYPTLYPRRSTYRSSGVDFYSKKHIGHRASRNLDQLFAMSRNSGTTTRPTQYGKSLGAVKILVLSDSHRSAEEVLKVLTDEECEDYVDVSRWEEFNFDGPPDANPPLEKPRVMRISTDWLDYRDAHGLERYEATRNVEVVHLPECSTHHHPAEAIRTALRAVHTPFHVLHSLLKTDYPPNNLLASLLSSSTTPLYTALVLALDGSPSHHEETLVKELSPHIPLILLSPHAHLGPSSSSRIRRSVHASTIKIRNSHDFRSAVLRSPETLATLRLEAADRFLRWREVERSVENALSRSPASSSVEKVLRDWKLHADDADRTVAKPLGSVRWDKARWEAEWEGSLSSDVSTALRQRKHEKKTREERKTMDRRLTVTARTRPSAISPLPFITSPISTSFGHEMRLQPTPIDTPCAF